MADYFGYNKTAKGPGNIVSTSMVLMSVGGSSVKLAQTINVNYSRNITPVFEVGSDSVYMVAGQSQGTWDVTRAVGDSAILSPYKPGDACATTSLAMSKGSGACGMDPGMLTATGCILRQVGFQANVGSTVVTDSASWQIGSLG